MVCSLQDMNGNPNPLNEYEIGFSSIHSHKGLESHVVILVDVEHIEKRSRMFYTGFARTKLKLIITKMTEEDNYEHHTNE
jgi:superfamily I DNA/RNA helicase